MKHLYAATLALFSLFTMHAQQTDVLKIMTYNLLNYRNATSYCPFNQNNPLTKEGYLKTVNHYVNPDILVCNEIGASATNGDFILLNALNTNGITYYQKADYSNNGFSSLVNMVFYNSNKVVLKSQSNITQDANGNSLVRVIDFYRFYYNDSLLTNQSDTVYFTVVAAHLKAGNTGADITERAAAAEALMDYLVTYVPDDNIILCGDLNIYKSQETAYQYLTQGTNIGHRLYDPLNAPGNWSNDGSFAYLHTQSTRSSATNGGCFSSGGLDDRLDHILISDEVRDNTNGMRYLPNSYFALGNDGLHFNKAITDNTNNSVPSNVLNALYGLSDHLPVVAEMEVKAQQIGVDENERLSQNLIVPNPVAETFALTVKNSAAQEITVRLLSLTGREILKGKTVAEGKNAVFTAPVHGVAKGLYLVEITTNNGWRATKKWLKQ